ncbi:MAG: Ig-like domain-containing protein [Chitinispirillaceae bacterium]|nr:Ig-like domain-containing protein [Chitinispirillaceae bacterium]
MRTVAFAAVTVVLFCWCAHQVSPGGGPDDKTGPTVMQTRPDAGAVMVDPQTSVTITFSEWILRTAAPRAVAILPPVDGGVRIRVSGRRLAITPVRAFADSTTYHVVLTSLLTDLRNNPLAVPFTLVFSTGPDLDSGKISGCVIDPFTTAVQALVGLYREQDSCDDTTLWGAPDYLAQTDSASFFFFENVKPGPCRIAGFIDRNGNGRLDPGAEQAYAPLSRTTVVSSEPDTILLFPVSSDTVRLRLTSVAPVSATTLLCALNAGMDSSRGQTSPSWMIVRADRSGAGPDIDSVQWINRGMQRCFLFLDNSLDRASYRLIFRYAKAACAGTTVVADTMRFNGAQPIDTTAPALVSVGPVTTVTPEPELALHFTEPVRVASPLLLTDTLGDSVPLIVPDGWADTVAMRPGRTLAAGGIYRLVLLSSSAKDLADLRLTPRDTTDTVLAPVFTVIQGDSLAISLKGCAACLDPDSFRTWQFMPLGGGPVSVTHDSGGCFAFDSIPAGRGFVSYFSDRNRNKKPDPGVLVPWRPPEPHFTMPDTIEARARWEIEGVALPHACTRCAKHRPKMRSDSVTVADRP